MKVLVLHGYSASNAGDGLLISETLDIIREAIAERVEFSVMALHPHTFAGLDAQVIDSSLRWYGYSQQFWAVRFREYDLVVAVGGGYLRAGHAVEAAKTAFAHGLQLYRASRTETPVVYLPQSVGPLRLGSAAPVRRLLSKVDTVFVRDDRSVAELGQLTNVIRTADLALMSPKRNARNANVPAEVPVLSVRSVRGRISPHVTALAGYLGAFDGYVQSTGAGNDDRAAMAALRPHQTLTREQLLTPDGPRRLVIAVRMHAALMALNAGHFVIHLAYERKGFGAFSDLGLSDYVFNVNEFDPAKVQSLTVDLLNSSDSRQEYNGRINDALQTVQIERQKLIHSLRSAAGVVANPDESGRS